MISTAMHSGLNPFQKVSHLLSSQSFQISPFLLPFLHTQRRAASILSNLSDNKGAYNRKIRRGRGPSSGKGKTSGRGHKGQKQHGKVPRGFNGGQTKDEIVHGKRGFKNVFSEDMAPVNLDKIQGWIDQGRIDPSRPITIKELADSRCVSNIKDGVKLLARGSEQLRSPFSIVISRASTAAIAAVEAAGGSIITRYYTPFAIQRILRGKTHPVDSLMSQPASSGGLTASGGKGFMYRLPDPTSRKDIEYYRDPAHRGYLSYQLQESQDPSLFYKPQKIEISRQRRKVKPTEVVVEKMW